MINIESGTTINIEDTKEKQEKKNREKKFIKMVNALENKRGIRVDVLFNSQEEDTCYDPNTDIIYVNACNLEGLLEELIHRAQFKALKKEYGSLEALVKSNMVDTMIASAEIAAKFLTISKMLNELEKNKENSCRSAELKSNISVEKIQILVYSQKLHASLKNLSQEQIKKLRQILSHPLFAGAQEIFNLVHDGINLEEVWYEMQNRIENKNKAD